MDSQSNATHNFLWGQQKPNTTSHIATCGSKAVDIVKLNMWVPLSATHRGLKYITCTCNLGSFYKVCHNLMMINTFHIQVQKILYWIKNIWFLQGIILSYAMKKWFHQTGRHFDMDTLVSSTSLFMYKRQEHSWFKYLFLCDRQWKWRSHY
jgi:hypothetical protein